ncbi:MULTISPECIES: cysteine dioxygenase family protein [unclassified Achromobacter]|uniref:cysteine dioxygenase family protein n=1 Tax=unclassified Achromobacter TaxID=2626865 RepID=UPI000B515D25|nr:MULTISPECIES: cysteine dioxygenase family protein [unclassified Achromobacter]OWT75504.1 cysteine dioxygenase [Achromobacter sp. HZ28]OWT76164.1 cysteine dioxygenase [Achromobacter sp. HZ34]
MSNASPSQAAPSSSSSVVAAERRQRVSETLADIRQLLAGRELSRELLADVSARLERLAQASELFGSADFPPPAGGQGESTRYRLNPDDGDSDIALYLNSINPGKTSVPHNHTTWAVIVAISGEELNRIYQRSDDGSDAEHAKLALSHEQVVRPGASIAFLPDDLHSIHVTGNAPTLHFHLYGQPLETLSGRIGIEPDTGRIINYNKAKMTKSVAAGG